MVYFLLYLLLNILKFVTDIKALLVWSLTQYTCNYNELYLVNFSVKKKYYSLKFFLRNLYRVLTFI